MNKYVMEKQDFEQIADLIKTTSSIETLYKRLFELEVEGKKDADVHRTTLDYLDIALEVENKLYSDCNLDSSKCIAWVNYLLKERFSENCDIEVEDIIKQYFDVEFKNAPKYSFADGLESIMKQDYSNRVIRRILNILIDKIITDRQFIKEQLPNGMEGLAKQSGIDKSDKIVLPIILQIISESVLKTLYNNIEIQKVLEEDLLNSYLYFLQESMSHNECGHFVMQLLRSKYNVAFINRNIENTMITSSFNIPDKIYMNSQLDSDSSKKENCGIDIALQQMGEIIMMNDMAYNDSNRAVTSTLRQRLMRAAFLFISDESLSELNYKFHEFVEGDEYLDIWPDDKISEQLIANCFRSIKKDKAKVNILSMENK